MSGPIFTIGGGSLARGLTFEIDRRIVRRTRKSRPHAVFIPTASGDNAEYEAAFHRTYGEQLGAQTESILLYRDRPSTARLQKCMRRADLVYVGGGNTQKMMALWRRLGLDSMVVAAWRRGAVMAGLSAGSICWYEYGHSDSWKYYDPARPYIRVRGLGLIRATHCPHYAAENRKDDFRAMIRKRGGVGLAVDNGSALEFEQDRWRLHSLEGSDGAFRLERRIGKGLVEEALPADRRWRSLEKLLH